MPRKKGPEAEIQTNIRKMLDAAGFTHFRMNSGMLRNSKGRLVKFGEKGMADLLTFVPMRVMVPLDEEGELKTDGVHIAASFVAAKVPMTVWIEVKAPGKKTTPDQDKFAERMRKIGHIYLVTDNIDDFANLVRLWKAMGE